MLLLAALLLMPVPALELRPAGGSAPGFLRPVWPHSRFDLTFTHSIFGIPVRERFEIDWWGRLVLREIRSTDARVVGYYDIPGARTQENPGDVRILDLALTHDELTLRSTPVGVRAYEDTRCRFPLTAIGGDWGAVTLRVGLQPLLLRLNNGGEFRCPPDPTNRSNQSSTPRSKSRRLSKTSRALPVSFKVR